MNKKELIKKIHAKENLTNRQITSVLNSLENEFIEAFIKGEEITLKGFGTFKIRIRKKRNYYDISKKMLMKLPEEKIIKFTQSKNLGKKINEKNQ